MKDFSKWEIGGIPAVVVFEALYSLDIFAELGITEAQLPHVMVLAFVVAVSIRMGGQKWLAKKNAEK